MKGHDRTAIWWSGGGEVLQPWLVTAGWKESQGEKLRSSHRLAARTYGTTSDIEIETYKQIILAISPAFCFAPPKLLSWNRHEHQPQSALILALLCDTFPRSRQCLGRTSNELDNWLAEWQYGKLTKAE